MKILLICTENLPVPPVLGGAIQTYISGSLPYLSKHHEITILGINDPSLPDFETIDGVDYVRVPGKVLEIYREGVVKYVESNQFDLIHIFNRPRLVMPIRKVAPNSKITLSMHNDMFNIGKIDPDEANLVIEEVSNIVTVSDYVGNVIKTLYPQSSDKVRTIYSGVDSERFLPGNDSRIVGTRNSLRREFGLENKTVILFAGRLSENKGVDRLIRALPELSKTFNNLALVIVGSNWFSQNNITDYVAYIRAISKRQNVPVITTGFVSPFEMQNWFAVADIFVCTSLWQEPLARVHYEAMAAGLPIVTTARGGNPEVIEPGENGYIVENPDDPSEFAAKITAILSNKSLMRSMGNNGRELAVSKYRWDRVANEILEVWDQSEFNSSVTPEQLEEYQSKLVFKTAPPTVTPVVIESKVEQLNVKNTTKAVKKKDEIKDKYREEAKVQKDKTKDINREESKVQKDKTKDINREESKVQKDETKIKYREESKVEEKQIVAPIQKEKSQPVKTRKEQVRKNQVPLPLNRIKKVTDRVSQNLTERDKNNSIKKVTEQSNPKVQNVKTSNISNNDQKQLKKLSRINKKFIS